MGVSRYHALSSMLCCGLPGDTELVAQLLGCLDPAIREQLVEAALGALAVTPQRKALKPQASFPDSITFSEAGLLLGSGPGGNRALLHGMWPKKPVPEWISNRFT